MTDLKTRLDRASAPFAPSGDLYEGTLDRVQRRRRDRRIGAAVVAIAVFSASASLLTTLLPRSMTQGGSPVCPRTVAPVEGGSVPGGLADASVAFPGDVWAVGPDEEVGPGSHAVVQRQRDGVWSSEPAVDGSTEPGSIDYFTGVAAITADDIWAVGTSADSYPLEAGNPSRALVEHWNGSGWSLMPVTSPGAIENRLNAVDGSASDDVWAVGYRVDDTRAIPMVQHWDGTSWDVVPSPNLADGTSGAVLDDVVAFTRTDGWAVGSRRGEALIEHWDGSRWSVVDLPDTPEQTFLQAVDGSSPSDVWAVGWTTTGGMATHPTPPAVLHFDGDSWRSIDVPVPSDRYVVPLAVTAVRRGDVWVSGWIAPSNDSEQIDTARPFVSHWNGREWKTVDTGVDEPASMITGSATDGESVWFVGRQGGHYTSEMAYLRGARSLAIVAACS